jgi:ABC-2 type transport system ATP-binding protein
VPALVLDNLVKVYGQVRAVDGLSLRAQDGEVTALIGPNGAGKTTTVEICEGLRSADGGQVRVLGLAPGERELRSRVGVMPQETGAWPGIRCRELLAVVSACYSHPLGVDDLLQRVGLDSAARTPVRQLSGGQQQRLSLVTAIVGRPELVFLDEPSAGLDVAARHLTWDLVRDLRAAGVSVVLTTHDMEEATLLADRVVVVAGGRCVAQGTVAELTRANEQARFHGPAGLSLAQLRTQLGQDTTVSEESGGSYLLSGRVDPQVLAVLTGWAASQSVLLTDVRVGQRTLQEVYLELTGGAR